MKKLVIFSILILMMPIVSAIGISPSRLTLDFKPNLDEIFTFYIINNNNEPVNATLYAYGELEKYVKILDKSSIIKAGDAVPFRIRLQLPKNLGKPGNNQLSIGAGETFLKERGGISATTAASAQLIVHSPYPGKYAQASLEVKEVNIGEPVLFTIKVDNLGKELISIAAGKIDILIGENIIKTIKTDGSSIEPQKTAFLKAELGTKNLLPGQYTAIASVNYDGFIASDQKAFRIGTQKVNLTNYSSIFYANTINTIDLWVKSLWNTNIEKLFGEVVIYKDGASVSPVLKTPTISLEPWQETRIVTFWDTSDILAGDYTAEVKLKYINKKDTYLVPIVLKKKFSINITLAILILVIILLFFNILLLLSRRRKKK